MGSKDRRRKVENKGFEIPMWMVTYADMSTLLLTFFVMLLAMAHFEEVGRVKAVIESIRTALGVNGMHTDLLGVTEQKKHQPKDVQKVEKLQPVQSRLQDQLSKHISDDMVRMTRERTEIRVALTDRVLFASGSTDLHPAAYSLLGDVAEVLGDYPVQVVVEGHTDSSGTSDQNWEISALRAVSVVQAMQAGGELRGDMLSAEGHGQYQPGAPNGSDSAWNRRVELVISSASPIAYDAVSRVETIAGGIHAR